MVSLNEAYAKLSTLSEERVRTVVSLIEDLAELEAREEATDLADAREALARIEAGETPVPLEEVVAKIDAKINGLPS